MNLGENIMFKKAFKGTAPDYSESKDTEKYNAPRHQKA